MTIADLVSVARALVTCPAGQHRELDAAIVSAILELARALAVLRGERQRMHKGVYEHTLVRKVKEAL